MTAEAVPATRRDRRKAHTRRALIDSAKQILAEGGSPDVSIQEITERADVGFGSFYNHFDSKSDLFAVAVEEVLEEFGQAIDRASADIEDPAESFVVGVRLTVRMALSQPLIAQVLVQVGYSYAQAEQGLAGRALRDIHRGVDAGRFGIDDPRLGLLATAGLILAFVQRGLAAPGELADSDADALAEMLLRALGMSGRSARALAHRPLPSLES